MYRKRAYLAVVCIIFSIALVACAAESEASGSNTKKFDLTLAVTSVEDPVLLDFVQEIYEQSDETIRIVLTPSSVLGSESDLITQVQTGALDMAKVSAANLSGFSTMYGLFTVPYVFDSTEHYYAVMDSGILEDIFGSTRDSGFVGILWLDNGARSFLTVDTPIRTPSDLEGKKIRTIDDQSTISTLDALGASATLMNAGEVYTSLQQGILDGVEDSVAALRNYGEVLHCYSLDEHTHIPNIVVLSADIWSRMSKEQQAIMTDCAARAADAQKRAWADYERAALDVAGEAGIQLVYDVDRPAFRAAVQPLYNALEDDFPEVYGLVEQVRALSQES